jgi:hypothetical protein
MPAMTFRELESFLRCVALPPFKLGVRTRLIEECEHDLALRPAAAKEAEYAVHVRAELARAGWWN